MAPQMGNPRNSEPIRRGSQLGQLICWHDRLPEQLVAGFRATLEEVVEA